MDKAITRSEFIRSNSALAGFFILPSGLLANSPNGRLTSSHIGIGGKGASRRVWAATLTRRSSKTIPKCSPRWATRSTLCLFRPQTPDPRPQTPDHIHYPATMAAMQLGKHVYTQKPLTNNIAEARALMTAAKKHKVFTQMGIQNQSSIAYRTATHLIRDGLIGKVSKVHVWSFKNWGYDGTPRQGEDPIPEGLDWNLWLGTAAKRAFLKDK